MRNVIIGDRNGVRTSGSFLVDVGYHAPMNSGLLYFGPWCANLVNIDYVDIYLQLAIHPYNGQAYSAVYNQFKGGWSAKNLIAC